MPVLRFTCARELSGESSLSQLASIGAALRAARLTSDSHAGSPGAHRDHSRRALVEIECADTTRAEATLLSLQLQPPVELSVVPSQRQSRMLLTSI